LDITEIDKFLQPLSEDNPCGEDLEYDPAFMEVETELEGKAERQMGDSIIEAEEPDWKKVYKDSASLLERTYDIRVLIFMIRAGIRLEGFSAFADGLTILHTWIDQFWDTVYPQLDPDDDNDPTERINVITSLCDFETTLKPFLTIPVVESKALGKYSLKDIRAAKEGSEAPSLATIEAAFTDCDIEQLTTRQTFLNTSIEVLEKLEASLMQQVGVGNAPNLDTFSSLLKEVQAILAEYITLKGGGGEESELIEVDVATDGANTTVGTRAVSTKPVQGVGSINSSQDVIKALEKVIEYYHKNEPSSPLPMLLERAKGLVNKDFMSIIKNIASDGESQVENLRGPTDDEDDDY